MTDSTTETPTETPDERERRGHRRGRRSTPTRRATELAILDALRGVVDPEIGMNVVELALIKQIILGPDSTEIKMILTTPFCPYAGSMIAQVKEQTETRGRPRRDCDPAGRALGSARRRPDVVTKSQEGADR